MKLKMIKTPKKSLVTILVLIICVSVLVFISHLYFQYTKSQAEIAHLRELAKVGITEEVEQLVTTVSKLMELPSGENPTIATITDKEKLKDQPFFDKAENGDKLLIYSQAKKAILYRPSTNKVVDVAPINISSSPIQAPPELTSSPTPKTP